MKKSTNQINIDNMLKRMEQIKKVSPSMCTAKWLQSTVYLMNGFTHSCHHPSAHKIPLSEIKNNPGALHNTNWKKKQRKLMLEGQRPSECQYCWNIEDLDGNHVSDRTYKSTDMGWSMPYLDRTTSATENINPSYLEVAFENTCNLKCAYCTPDISSKWMEEIQQFGAYPTSHNTGNLDWLKQQDRMPIPNREENPYVDAFWEWWPDLYEDLNTFRITGGEPLLSKNTWRILEYVKENPRSDFNLAINTNMDVPDQFIDKLIDYHREISPNINSFDIYTSCEAVGEQAEYIRFGLNYDRFLNNIRKFLSNTNSNSKLHFMVTFNALSITTFEQFLSDIWNLRVEFNEDDALNRIPMMINYLRWPPFMSMQILPRDIKEKYGYKYKAYISAHTRVTSPNKAGRFYLEEVDQIERLTEFMLQEPPTIIQDKRDFGIYFEEYDRRRATNFNSTFPELSKFFEGCKKDE